MEEAVALLQDPLSKEVVTAKCSPLKMYQEVLCKSSLSSFFIHLIVFISQNLSFFVGVEIDMSRHTGA